MEPERGSTGFLVDRLLSGSPARFVAVTGTANLRQLAGRFTLPVELTDADVEEVIWQVILAKQPGAIRPIDQVMEGNLGEISRYLSGTSLRHTRDDLEVFAQDYPILPVRRRFWENTLRVLDQTGTESQLRNQLSMIHKGARKKTTPGSGAGTAATIFPAVPPSPANASTTAIIRLKPSERRENATVTNGHSQQRHTKQRDQPCSRT